MGSPYSSVSVSNYNANPPPDDGSQTDANEITWAGIKTKIGDPLKAGVEGVNTNVQTAFGKLFGFAVATQSATYTLQASDERKLIACSNTFTLTLLAAATAGAGFVVAIQNVGTGTVTLDGDGSETIDGATTLVLDSQYEGAILICDGANWHTVNNPANLAKLDAANTFTADLEIEKASPVLTLDAVIATPADDDNLGRHSFKGRNDADEEIEYAYVLAAARDVSDGTEDGRLRIGTMRAGTAADEISVEGGIILGAATGGAPGLGKINAAGYELNGKPIEGAKARLAWTGSAELDSFNVSSVTDNAVGDFTVNFDTDFAAATYTVTGACRRESGESNTGVMIANGGTYAATACQIVVTASAGDKDVNPACVAFFGD